MLIAFIFVKVLVDVLGEVNFTTEAQKTRRYTEIVYEIPP